MNATRIRTGTLIWPLVLPILSTVSNARAQEPCEPHWDVTIGQPGTNSLVFALAEHAGELYAGGWFSVAGGQTVNSIARWDGSAWHPLAVGGEIGLGGSVEALVVHDGALVAAGWFETAGGAPVNHIARWDGSAWHPYTSGGQIGLDGGVRALAVHGGQLVAGGSFLTAGGQTVNRIARWDGSAWHPFASGGEIGTSGDVRALLSLGGELYVGGSFESAGGQTVNRIARWDGSAWHPFASGGAVGVDDDVRALSVLAGELVAGGFFLTAGVQVVNRIARWDGSAWHPFAAGGQIGVSCCAVSALLAHAGELFAAGDFSAAGRQTVYSVARWDGAAWHPLASGSAIGVDLWVEALASHGADLAVGGAFTTAGGASAAHVATFGRRCRAFCFGDGSGTPCPCSNAGGPREGCANSTGAGATLAATGTSSVSRRDLALAGAALAPAQPGLYFQGDRTLSGGQGTAFGDGLRCVGGSVLRLEIRTADATGASSTTANIAHAGGAAPGETRYYQLWYRDPIASPCGTGFNLTHGLEILWSP